MTGDNKIASVTGGAGGVEASYVDIESLAAIFDSTGDGLRRDAWDDKALALNGDLLESAILSPGSFADAEAAVIEATIGPRGLAFRAVGLEADALSMQVSVALLRAGDDLVRESFEVLDYLSGYVVGVSLPVLGLIGLTGGAALLLDNPALAGYLAAHPEVRDRLLEQASDDIQGFLEAHPELVQHLINGGGGLVDGLLGTFPPGVREAVLLELGLDPFHATTNDVAADLAGLFDDSEPIVTPGSAEPRDLTAPGSLEELLLNLVKTNDGADGEIDIQQIGEGDDARYVINLPGTDSWMSRCNCCSTMKSST